VITAAGVPPMRSSPASYLLISPCRNESDFMRQTLDTVTAQTVRPAKWVIVDDGSTDDTPRILAEYAARHDWIQIVTRANRGHRSVGPGVIEAFYAGYAAIDPDAYEFVCKLDLDLDLPPRYFEILIERMRAEPRLGTCSGKAYLRDGDTLVNERHGDENSLGMTKFYRVACFKDIGGFVRAVGWDGIDGHMCRMRGWAACSWDEPELRFVHLRTMGASHQGILTGRYRQGYGQYFMGTGLLYLAVGATLKMNQKPYVIGQLAVLWGWVHSWLTRKPRFDDPPFRDYLRNYQRLVLLRGKRRATEAMQRALGQVAR
jgi:biofilm PGA synthesis N-glycosyltransferase PgaC